MAEYETMWGGVTRRSDEREHYHDRAERAAEAGLVLDVYIPKEPTTIAPRSGVVGSPSLHEAGTVVIDFEGNLFGSSSLTTWAERTYHAASRHVTAYPTVARMTVPSADLVKIGTYDVATDMIHIDDRPALLRWLGEAEFGQLFRTKAGSIMTEAAINRLSREAERGYDVSKLREITELRRGR